MIYLTGDTHGDISNLEAIASLNKLTEDDYLIILGDFGFLWYNESNEVEKKNIETIRNYPWKTLFIDGNHENFKRINSLPSIDMFHSRVGVVDKDKIFHLQRGNIYSIEDNTFFTMGGATSIDKFYRVKDISWFEAELPSKKEIKQANSNLKSYNYQVDYVLTHTPPEKIVNIMTNAHSVKCPCAIYLEKLYNRLEFKYWYSGHMHDDAIFPNRRLIVLYHELLKLGETTSESSTPLSVIY